MSRSGTWSFATASGRVRVAPDEIRIRRGIADTLRGVLRALAAGRFPRALRDVGWPGGGAVLALGVQDLFANIVGGLVITFERPYTVGDKVEIGDHYGEVTDIGVRSTKLVTPDDSAVTVPNYLLFTNSVSNANAGSAEMMVVVEFHVAADADIDRALSVVHDGLRTSRYVHLSEDHGVYVLVERVRVVALGFVMYGLTLNGHRDHLLIRKSDRYS